MEFHPSKIPIEKLYKVTDERGAAEAAESIAAAWLSDRKAGFKILMPKDKKLAKRMGYTAITTVNYLLRKSKIERNVRYWVYHEDDAHYAIVLIDAHVLELLGF